MAVIIPANLAPDTMPRIRGVILTQPWRGLWVVRSWPKKRGKPKDWTTRFLSQQFAYAGRMAANPEPKSYATAVFLSQGSHWVPRDILTLAAYGKLYEIVFEDGTTSTQADHGAPAPPGPKPMANQWLYSNYATPYTAANSTTAFAFKGSAFIPSQPMTILMTQAVITPVIGGFYRMIICRLNGANVIQEIATSAAIVAADTLERLYEFDLGFTLTAGERYALMIGRSDNTNTYALPTPFVSVPTWLFPHTYINSARIAQVNPIVGQTVDVSLAGTPTLGVMAEY